MSASCCGQDAQFDGVSAAFKRALWIVIAINGAMFIVEMAAGAFAGSKALQADALDFLGDTTTYAISLYVIGMALHVRATAALIKGLSLAAMGLWVFGSTAYQVLVLGVPSATVMGGVGLLALLANLCRPLEPNNFINSCMKRWRVLATQNQNEIGTSDFPRPVGTRGAQEYGR